MKFTIPQSLEAGSRRLLGQVRVPSGEPHLITHIPLTHYGRNRLKFAV
jgi:hypothetical protein